MLASVNVVGRGFGVSKKKKKGKNRGWGKETAAHGRSPCSVTIVCRKWEVTVRRWFGDGEGVRRWWQEGGKKKRKKK